MKLLSSKKIKAIFKRHKVLVAYAFGSQVEGCANESSDLDIAVLLARKGDLRSRFKTRLHLISELTLATRIECDVLILNDIPSVLMRYNIITYGVPIFIEDSAARLEYESKVMSEYWEFRPFLDQLNKQYVKDNS